MFTCAARLIASPRASSRIDRLVQDVLSRPEGSSGGLQPAGRPGSQHKLMQKHAGGQGGRRRRGREEEPGKGAEGRASGEVTRAGAATRRPAVSSATSGAPDWGGGDTGGREERERQLSDGQAQRVERPPPQESTCPFPLPPSSKPALRPNVFICPTCLGEPGSLPSPSKEAVETALRAAMLLQCEVIREWRPLRSSLGVQREPVHWRSLAAR